MSFLDDLYFPDFEGQLGVNLLNFLVSKQLDNINKQIYPLFKMELTLEQHCTDNFGTTVIRQ